MASKHATRERGLTTQVDSMTMARG